MIERLLFACVIVALTASDGLRTAEPHRRRRVRIAGHKSANQAIHTWSRHIGAGDESRFSVPIRRHRISGEVVIKRNVLLENNHEVLHRSSCVLRRKNPCPGYCARKQTESATHPKFLLPGTYARATWP